MTRKSESRGFTLIELLVVIALIALLMSILLACLQRARTQAGGVICQARLRQWGLAFKIYLDENANKWFGTDPEDLGWVAHTWWFWRDEISHYPERREVEYFEPVIVEISQGDLDARDCPICGHGESFWLAIKKARWSDTPIPQPEEAE